MMFRKQKLSAKPQKPECDFLSFRLVLGRVRNSPAFFYIFYVNFILDEIIIAHCSGIILKYFNYAEIK